MPTSAKIFLVYVGYIPAGKYDSYPCCAIGSVAFGASRQVREGLNGRARKSVHVRPVLTKGSSNRTMNPGTQDL